MRFMYKIFLCMAAIGSFVGCSSGGDSSSPASVGDLLEGNYSVENINLSTGEVFADWTYTNGVARQMSNGEAVISLRLEAYKLPYANCVMSRQSHGDYDYLNGVCQATIDFEENGPGSDGKPIRLSRSKGEFFGAGINSLGVSFFDVRFKPINSIGG